MLIDQVDFSKGLVPAVVQDSRSKAVLMLGYMNREALAATLANNKVTFFSRSKNRLWTKGESSGNYLLPVSLRVDCDNDTILVEAQATGPACHRGTTTCFDASESSASQARAATAEKVITPEKHFLEELEKVVKARLAEGDAKSSYTAKLAQEGIDRLAQKVGEEAIEIVIAAKNHELGALTAETADLIFHLTVLLQARGLSWQAIGAELERRAKRKG